MADDNSKEWILLQHINIRTALLATVVFTLIYLILRQSGKKWNLPPGPKLRLPILGHLAFLDRASPYRTMAELGQQYGPIVSLQFGAFPAVVLNDYSSVYQAFVKQGQDFDDRPNTIITGDGLVHTRSGDFQQSRRRFAMAALRNLGMGKFRFEDQIIAEIKCLLAKFTSYKSQPFCPFPYLGAGFSNVFCCLAFGKRYKYDDPKFQQLLRLLNRIVELAALTGAALFIPLLRYIPFSGTRKLLNFPEYPQYFEEMVKENAKDYIPNQPRNYIDMYLDHQEIGKDKAFNHKDLIRCLCDLFGGGTETSATTNSWGLLYMTLNPDIQDRVHQELDKVIGTDRMITLSDRKHLPYTEATLLEIQRIRSVLPVGVPHSATVNTQLNGYDIPKGTVVISNIWGVHHDPAVWDCPDEFRPDRFLDKEGCLIRREELIPFSLGRRECLGKQLANMELFLFYANILNNFTFTLPDGADPPNMEGILGSTLTPRPVDLCATPRGAMVFED